MNPLLKKLAGSDRRSIGRSGEVVAEVLADPRLFGILFEGMLADDAVLRMRCADAVEKITARRPNLLQPYKKALIQKVAMIDQQEVRWHVALMIPRLKLTKAERRAVVSFLNDYLNDKSKIVKTFSMQALAEIAGQDSDLRASIVPQLEALTRTGSPAMQSRGRKLLAKLKSMDPKSAATIVDRK
jgi:hypothetical protein